MNLQDSWGQEGTSMQHYLNSLCGLGTDVDGMIWPLVSPKRSIFLTCSSPSSIRPYGINTFKRAWVERVGDYVHSAVSTGRGVATDFSLWVQVAAWGIESHKFGVYFRVHWHFTTVANTAPDAVGSTHLCWNALWPISLAALFTSSGTASFSASETWYTAWPASSR